MIKKSIDMTSCDGCNCGEKAEQKARYPSNSLVGQKAPCWKGKALVNGEIAELSFEDFKGKYHVILFYPLDFTFVCPTELIAFSDNIDKFRALGADVIGVSVDSVYSHMAWSQIPRAKGGLHPINIPLMADVNKELAKQFGVLWDDSIALRGLFIIDDKGIVRHATINDLGIGRSVEEALRVLKAIQFHNKHGEVCPANWQPGQDTIVPEPKGSLKYFEAVKPK